MKNVKVAASVLLWVVVLVLAYLLYNSLREPVRYTAQVEEQRTATIERLKNFRTAQKAFYEATGHYTANPDSLIDMYKTGSITEIKTIGDPYDTTVTVTYDTIEVAITETDQFTIQGDEPVDSVVFVPNSGGQMFEMEAGYYELQRVNIPVFEARAPKEVYLKGIPEKYTEKEKDVLTVGSMTDGSDAGNWE